MAPARTGDKTDNQQTKQEEGGKGGTHSNPTSHKRLKIVSCRVCIITASKKVDKVTSRIKMVGTTKFVGSTVDRDNAVNKIFLR